MSGDASRRERPLKGGELAVERSIGASLGHAEVRPELSGLEPQIHIDPSLSAALDLKVERLDTVGQLANVHRTKHPLRHGRDVLSSRAGLCRRRSLRGGPGISLARRLQFDWPMLQLLTDSGRVALALGCFRLICLLFAPRRSAQELLIRASFRLAIDEVGATRPFIVEREEAREAPLSIAL